MNNTWNGDQVTDDLMAMLAQRVEKAGAYVTEYIKDALSRNVGSVVPFVASASGEYPYLWDGTLRDSIKQEQSDDPLIAIVSSDAVDQHVHPGHHFSGAEEFGSWWDGFAWDFQTGRIVKVAPAHEVEGRHFMERGLLDCGPKVFEILAGV